MKNNRPYYLLILLTLLTVGCGTGNEKETPAKPVAIAVQADSLQQPIVEIKESFNQEDIPVNEFLTDRLAPIRANFKKNNSITKWTSIETKELPGSAEGGEAKYYYKGKQLEKIVARQYGETFQLLTEYYLLDGQLSFVFEKEYRYNRPFYYDSTAMKETNDSEAFDFAKSEIIEDRSYFDKGKLIHQVNNQDCGSPFTTEYLLEEQKRIKADFDQLIELTKNK